MKKLAGNGSQSNTSMAFEDQRDSDEGNTYVFVSKMSLHSYTHTHKMYLENQGKVDLEIASPVLHQVANRRVL